MPKYADHGTKYKDHGIFALGSRRYDSRNSKTRESQKTSKRDRDGKIKTGRESSSNKNVVRDDTGLMDRKAGRRRQPYSAMARIGNAERAFEFISGAALPTGQLLTGLAYCGWLAILARVRFSCATHGKWGFNDIREGAGRNRATR